MLNNNKIISNVAMREKQNEQYVKDMIEGESSGEDESKKFKVKVNLKSRNILAAKKFSSQVNAQMKSLGSNS